IVLVADALARLAGHLLAVAVPAGLLLALPHRQRQQEAHVALPAVLAEQQRVALLAAGPLVELAELLVALAALAAALLLAIAAAVGHALLSLARGRAPSAAQHFLDLGDLQLRAPLVAQLRNLVLHLPHLLGELLERLRRQLLPELLGGLLQL